VRQDYLQRHKEHQSVDNVSGNLTIEIVKRKKIETMKNEKKNDNFSFANNYLDNHISLCFHTTIAIWKATFR